MALGENGADAAMRIIFQLSTDAGIVDLYEATDGREGNPIADMLAVEMERREIEF